MSGVVDVFCRGDPVVRGDIGLFLTLAVDPLDALANVEGPDGLVIVRFPALGKTRLDIAVLVVVHQAVNDIGTDGVVIGRARGEVVQSLHFSGVERVERGAVVRSCLAPGSSGRGAACAAAGRAAAAGCQRQTHGAGQGAGKEPVCLFHSNLLFRGMAAACFSSSGPAATRTPRELVLLIRFRCRVMPGRLLTENGTQIGIIVYKYTSAAKSCQDDPVPAIIFIEPRGDWVYCTLCSCSHPYAGQHGREARRHSNRRIGNHEVHRHAL